MIGLLGLVPLPYRILGVALLAVALVIGGFSAGAKVTGDHWQAKVAEAERKAAAIAQQQTESTAQVVTKYVDRVQLVRVAGETITKEVPVYVTPESDAHCAVPRGFVRLHDAAAANSIPKPPGPADASPAGIALSAVASTVADNYTRCHENSAQLEALQGWVRDMQAAENDR